MKGKISAWLLGMVILAAMFFSACQSPNQTGADVLPKDDLISSTYVDDFNITVKPVLIDSVFTGNLTRNMLGNYLDPEFGRISAGTYTQFRLAGNNVVFGDNADSLKFDSLVLSLDLTGFYGRFNSPMEVEIFEVTQEWPDSNLLYASDFSLAFDSSKNLAEGFSIDFSQRSGFFDFIRIPLDASLGEKLLKAPADSLANNTNFLSFFKGLYIRTRPVDLVNSREPGGVFYMDLRTDNSDLNLYYKDTTVAETYTFTIGSEARRFHTIRRTETQGTLWDQILQDTLLDFPPYSAIQSGALVKTFIKVEGLDSIKPAGIHRAELILNVDASFTGSGDRYSPPDELFLFIADSTGKREFDVSQLNSSGSYDPATSSYTIPLTNTLAQILAGRLPDNGFILVPGSKEVTLNRAVIGAGGNTNVELLPKFRVTYSTLPR